MALLASFNYNTKLFYKQFLVHNPLQYQHISRLYFLFMLKKNVLNLLYQDDLNLKKFEFLYHSIINFSKHVSKPQFCLFPLLLLHILPQMNHSLLPYLIYNNNFILTQYIFLQNHYSLDFPYFFFHFLFALQFSL